MNDKYLKIFIQLDAMPDFVDAVKQSRASLDLPINGLKSGNGKQLRFRGKKEIKIAESLDHLREVAENLLKNIYPGISFEKNEWEASIIYFYKYLFSGLEGVQSLQPTFYGIKGYPVGLLANKGFINKLREEYKEGVLIVVKPSTTSAEIKQYLDKQYKSLEVYMIQGKSTKIRGKIKLDLDKICKSVYLEFKNYSVRELRGVLRAPNIFSKDQAMAMLVSKRYIKEIGVDTFKSIIRRMKIKKEL